MTLTDPHEALADKSDFIGYLVGLAALGDLVRGLAADDGRRTESTGDCDDFVHVLLGLVSTGAAIERMAKCVTEHQTSSARAEPATAASRWLR